MLLGEEAESFNDYSIEPLLQTKADGADIFWT